MLEEATDFQLPFGMGTVDVSNPASAVVAIVALVGGMTVWNMTDDIGENLAAQVNSMIGSVIGRNPATGQSEETGGAFD
jgi:xanthosine utilization system XapX-like protein